MREDLPQGAILDEKYRILSVIGRGAWSSVYLARDLHGVGQFWAVKEISTHELSAGDREAMARSFSQEAEILAGLQHEGLPRIQDFIAVGTAYYLVMEWIAGQTLLTMMEERGEPFPVLDVLRWGIDLCRILGYLHTLEPHAVVVGDLKPGNIMRTFEGQLKIVDFGVARYAQPHRPEGCYAFVTPGYSPPEQYDTTHIDARSDIYALGATMFYLMTGQDMAKLRFQVPPLRRLVPTAPAALEEIMARCLHTNRNGRFLDVAVLRRRLQGVLEAEDPHTGRPASQARDILSTLYQAKKQQGRQGIRGTLDED